MSKVSQGSLLNLRILALAIVMGLVIGACGFGVDYFIHDVRRLYASDFYTTIVAFGLSYALLIYERRRRVILARRMEVAAEVNHHIRNALTAVVFSASVQNDPSLQSVLQDATARIDWVLNSVLPDDVDAFKWPVQASSWRPSSWTGQKSSKKSESK